MMKKRTIVKAKYKDGVLRPARKLDLPDNTTVEIIIYPDGAQKHMRELLKKIHERNAHIPPEEIERDIAQAIREIREENQTKPKAAGRSR